MSTSAPIFLDVNCFRSEIFEKQAAILVGLPGVLLCDWLNLMEPKLNMRGCRHNFFCFLGFFLAFGFSAKNAKTNHILT